MAQPKCFIVPHEMYLDRAGKQFAFKVTYQDVVDTIYFVDIASGMITDRVAEGTFGLELKMLKAKVLNWEEEMQPNLDASISAWGRGKWEKYNRYEIRSKSSMLASAWLPYTFTQHSSDLRCIFKSSPQTVLL